MDMLTYFQMYLLFVIIYYGYVFEDKLDNFGSLYLFASINCIQHNLMSYCSNIKISSYQCIVFLVLFFVGPTAQDN